jgi:hypothetical protein
VAGGPVASKHFSGHQTLATADALDAFVRRAQAGEEFVYCEAPEPIRGETWSRVTYWAQLGFVSPHQQRREGGGWRYYVGRTRKRITREQSPQEKALSDPATDTIFRELKRAANFAQPCPSATDLARTAGLGSRHAAQFRFRQLIAAKLIESMLAYEGGVPTRVVTIVDGPLAGTAAGKSTALPAKWAALQQAAVRECRLNEGAGQ